MTMEAALKTAGYLVSTVSVMCLGVVSWDGAKEKPALFILLLAGMATSVGGMLLRWMALLAKQREEKAREAGIATAVRRDVQDSLNAERTPAATVRRP